MSGGGPSSISSSDTPDSSLGNVPQVVLTQWSQLSGDTDSGAVTVQRPARTSTPVDELSTSPSATSTINVTHRSSFNPNSSTETSVSYRTSRTHLSAGGQEEDDEDDLEHHHKNYDGNDSVDEPQTLRDDYGADDLYSSEAEASVADSRRAPMVVRPSKLNMMRQRQQEQQQQKSSVGSKDDTQKVSAGVGAVPCCGKQKPLDELKRKWQQPPALCCSGDLIPSDNFLPLPSVPGPQTRLRCSPNAVPDETTAPSALTPSSLHHRNNANRSSGF